MVAPLQSTITLGMELLIAVVIATIIYRAWAKNIFMRRLAIFAVAYETVFNIGYMILRSAHASKATLSPQLMAVGAVHGILSLVIFVAVIVLFWKASKSFSKGENYFQKHTVIAALFLLGWIISLLSGLWLYWAAYYR